MGEEIDFSKLLLEDRLSHKSWKARVSGYEEAIKLFEIQADENSPEYQKYLGQLKKFVLDNNAIAQEKGISAVLAFVQNAECAPKSVNDVMNALVSKCFSSPRAKTREMALEVALMYIEVGKQDVVSEELIKGLANKSPKVVSACVVALREALHLFGSKDVLVKPLAKELPKLLEDRDEGVRYESKKLLVEIYRWVGEAIGPQLNNLKPVQLSELKSEFQKIAGERIAPTRYLKSQKEKIAKIKESEDATGDTSEESLPPPPQVDLYDLMTAVDVLSKLPSNFYDLCEAKKWQERKQALDTLLQMTTPEMKLESGDYGDLVRALNKMVSKDSNVVVVASAIKCLTHLILGLRKKFQPYTSACVPAVLEKFKEKKKNVVVALRECIDFLYSINTFEAMFEDIQASLNSKNPQVKAETCAFLLRAFTICPATQLNEKILKAFTESLLKTLNDSDATVRENAAGVIGTVMKVVGERVMNKFLQNIEAIKRTKIKEFYDKAEVAQPQVTKKTPVDTSEPEFMEQDITEEDVLTQASEILTEDVINGLGSSNWKDRLLASENFFKAIRAMKKGALPGQCLVKVLAKKPGFKDNNFQILKLRFEILAYIAENAQISHITVVHCLSDIVDKTGDAKNGTYAGLALTALAGATNLEYVSLEVLNLAFNQKNPKNLSESLVWLSNAIKHFGFKIQVKEVLDYLKKGFASKNPAVRNAALALVGTIYLYVGKPLRIFFVNEKPTLLKQIIAEFDKMTDIKLPLREKGKATKADGAKVMLQKILISM